MNKNICIVSVFLGTVLENILPEKFDLVLENSPYIKFNQTKIQLETKISPNDQEFYFFFSIKGQIYRLRLYQNEKKLYGDIRRKIDFRDYELVYILKTEDVITDSLNISNLNYYESYWRELNK